MWPGLSGTSAPAGRRTFVALALPDMSLALAVALVSFPLGGLPARILRLAALVIASLAAERGLQKRG